MLCVLMLFGLLSAVCDVYWLCIVCIGSAQCVLFAAAHVLYSLPGASAISN